MVESIGSDLQHCNFLTWLTQAKKRHKSDFARLSDDLHQIRQLLESYTAKQRSINSQIEAAVESKPGLDEVGTSTIGVGATHQLLHSLPFHSRCLKLVISSLHTSAKNAQ